jgi:DNA-binding transcriptional LysR family regulator
MKTFLEVAVLDPAPAQRSCPTKHCDATNRCLRSKIVDIRQFEYFTAVAEELSFTKAAARLTTTQSTVSAAVRVLEREVGTELIDRSTKRIRLTPAGRTFFPEAKAALAAFALARDAAREVTDGLRGSMRIGTIPGLTAIDMPGLIKAFRASYPLVDLHLRASTFGSTGIVDELRHDRLDVGVVGGLHADTAPDLTLVRITEVPYIVVLPEDHRLAGRREIGVEDLAGEAFVDGEPGFGSRIITDQLFRERGVSRRILVEVADIRTVPEFVCAIDGVGIGPKFALAPGSGVVLRPLKGRAPTLPLSLAAPTGRQLARPVTTFLELAPQFIRDADVF